MKRSLEDDSSLADVARAKASWRRFWRSGPQTPRQVADEALLRIDAALAEQQSPHETDHDPYDDYLVEWGSDPLTVQQDKARRVAAGQTARRMKRREQANKHRR